MKYAVETGSGAMMCIPSFIKNWFSHSEGRMSLHLFFQNKESMAKKE
jgi:hypothetical protein